MTVNFSDIVTLLSSDDAGNLRDIKITEIVDDLCPDDRVAHSR